MDFVHEEDGLFPEPPIFFRLFHHLFDLLDAAGDGGKVDEIRLGAPRDDAGEGGFSYPGRTPEDHGADVVALDQPAQNLSFAEQVFLPAVFFQRLRAEPRRQRLACGAFE